MDSGPSRLRVPTARLRRFQTFALWLGNSGATTIDQMMDGAYNGGVTDYNFHIGFNISRQFDIFVD